MHIKNTTHYVCRHALRLLMVLAIALGVTAVRGADTTTAQRDTIRRQPMTPIEVNDIRSRMVSSPQPVLIHQQGRLLRVESQTAQLLPVYTRHGTLYTAFRLSKGTNWLGGLPRGHYIINNKHFAIN